MLSPLHESLSPTNDEGSNGTKELLGSCGLNSHGKLLLVCQSPCNMKHLLDWPIVLYVEWQVPSS